MKAIKTSFVYVLFCVVVAFYLVFFRKFLGIDLVSSDRYTLFIAPFVAGIAFILFVPPVQRNFLNNWRKKDFTTTICSPILITILLLFITYYFMFSFPNAFLIGNGQVHVEQYNFGERFIGAALLATFTEELIFRLGLFVAWDGLYKKLTKRNIFPSLHKFLTPSIFIMLQGILFGFAHLPPNIFSFLIYASMGWITGWLFIKNGFLSSWIAHMTYNSLTSIVFIIMYRFFI